MSYRMALRRTQRDVDSLRKMELDVSKADRKTLQALAKKAGIPANQSTEALRKALS